MSLATASLACQALTVRYAGQARPALDGVTMAVPAGAITAVVGPNGSGKSTLVRALLRRVPLDAGDITVRGRPLAAWTPRALAREVAVVPQREEPVMPLLVEEFVALGCHPRRSAFGALAAADRHAVGRAMARAGVAWAAAQSARVRDGVVTGTGPTQQRSCAATSPKCSTTPLGTTTARCASSWAE